VRIAYKNNIVKNKSSNFDWIKLNEMEQNELYPIFLKLHNLNVLIVGGGNVGLEKLSFLLKSSPNANVEVVAPDFHLEIKVLAENHPSIKLTEAKFKKKMLKKRHMVIACTDDLKVNKRVYDLSRKRYLICNIADTPDLCDYYLGGIVTKGNVKIAISTNGKSPTTAKRLREFFEEVIPEDINQMVENLNEYRKTLKGDFEEKVKRMNEITNSLKNKE
jgi:precorrin-2 dehydrogenase/sirohydrochlorin ferrochelatase